MTLSEIAAVVGGEVVDGDGDGDGAVVVTGPATIDSRDVEPGGLFAAFVGERADGHAFAADAVAAGAAAVLGSRATGEPSVLVPDPRAALAALAHHLLSRLPGVTVLAITGSQGKTSTKDLLAGVLADRAETVATRGSFNNELGLPLTVLRATESTRFLLLEMGARGVGHIAELCTVARPDVSVVLNVGKAHLGEFGTQDDIARAKGELVEALPAEGTAVLNADDPRVVAMRERTDAHVLTFGRERSGADVVATDVHLDGNGRPSFRLHHAGTSATVRLRLVGDHHVTNAAAAAAAALATGAELPDVARSLGSVQTLSRWRMEVSRRQDGVTVVNDAYNANPDSMAAALRALASLGTQDSRRVAVLGEMKELGASTAEEHAEVGRLARSLGIHVVVAVGDVARDVHATGRERPEADRGTHEAAPGGEDEMASTQTGGSTTTLEVTAADNEAAVRWLDEHLRPGDVVLLKASRGARLDEVADALLRGHGEVTA